MDRRRAAGALVALAACVAYSAAAPTTSNQTTLDLYEGAEEGCYYNFQHYGEGDRIMTNEPCLNCTCHNRMLMCYLRVCPFTKPIGQDCTVEKRADQCCPIVTCPDVPVDLLTSTSTNSPMEYGSTGLGKLDSYGCSINGRYLPEGSKVPPTPNKPCEHCYCIRNMTTCVMQECTLHVDGCTPIYHKDVCCPVRYSCDHPEDEIPLLDDMTTTVRPTPGFLLTTTTLSPVTQISQDCVHDNKVFPDGALIKTEKACEHCYCMKGDIVCVVQECGTPMENEGKNCTSLPPREGQCCPDTYICEGDDLINGITDVPKHTSTYEEVVTVEPPKRVVDEGSGYTEHEESYTGMPVIDSEIEGSGEDNFEKQFSTSEMTEHVTPKLIDESFIETTHEVFEQKPSTTNPLQSTTEPDSSHNTIPSEFSEDSHSISSLLETTLSSEGKRPTEPTIVTVSKPVYSEESVTSLPDLTTEKSFRKDDQGDIPKESSTHKEFDETFTTIQTDTINETEPTSDNKISPEKTELKPTSMPSLQQVSQGEETTEPKEPLEGIEQEPVKQSTETSDRFGTTEVVPENIDVTEPNKLIKEDSTTTTYPSRIPGEGDCLYNGVTYTNESDVPTSEKCDLSCKCVSSIVRCEPVICSPVPEFMENCQEVYDSSDSCCPTYVCQSKETIPPQSQSQMSGTESPLKKPVIQCSGRDCGTEEKEQSEMPESSKDSSVCEGEDCVKTNLPEIAPCEGELCTKVKSECETAECKSNELSSATSGPCTEDNGCQKSEDKVEQECADDNCRRKLVPDAENKPLTECLGTECLLGPEISTDEQLATTVKPVTNELATEVVTSALVTEPSGGQKGDEAIEKEAEQMTLKPHDTTEPSDLMYISSEPTKVETPSSHFDDLTIHGTETYTEAPESKTTFSSVSQEEVNTVPQGEFISVTSKEPETLKSETPVKTDESGPQDETYTLPSSTFTENELNPHVTVQPDTIIDEHTTERNEPTVQDKNDAEITPEDDLLHHVTLPTDTFKTPEPITEAEPIYTNEPYTQKPDVQDVVTKFTEPSSSIVTESELLTTIQPDAETSPELSISEVTLKPSQVPEESDLQEKYKTVSGEYVTKATLSEAPEHHTIVPELEPQTNIVTEMPDIATELPEVHGTSETSQAQSTEQPTKEELMTLSPESFSPSQPQTTESLIIGTEEPKVSEIVTEHREKENEIPTVMPEHKETTEVYEKPIFETQTTENIENEVVTESLKDKTSLQGYPDEIASPEADKEKENENEIPTESPALATTSETLKSSEFEPLNEVRGEKTKETTVLNILSNDLTTESLEHVSGEPSPSEYSTGVPQQTTFEYSKDGSILKETEPESPKHQPQDYEIYTEYPQTSTQGAELLATSSRTETKPTTLSSEIKTEIPEYLTSNIPEHSEQHEIDTEDNTGDHMYTTESLVSYPSETSNQAAAHPEQPTATETYYEQGPVTDAGELSTSILNIEPEVTPAEKAIDALEISQTPEPTEHSVELITNKPEQVAETESVESITDSVYTQKPISEVEENTHTMEPSQLHVTKDLETIIEKHEMSSTESVTLKYDAEYATTGREEELHTEMPILITLSDKAITMQDSKNELQTENYVPSETELPPHKHEEKTELPSLDQQTTLKEKAVTTMRSDTENVPTEVQQTVTSIPEEHNEADLKDVTVTASEVISTENPRIIEISQTPETSDLEKQDITFKPEVEEFEPTKKVDVYPVSSISSVTEPSMEVMKTTEGDIQETEYETHPVSIDSTALPSISETEEAVELSTEAPKNSVETTVNHENVDVNEIKDSSATEKYESITKQNELQEEVTFATKVPDYGITKPHDEGTILEITTETIDIHDAHSEDESKTPFISEPQTETPLSLVTEVNDMSEPSVPGIKLSTLHPGTNTVTEQSELPEKEAEEIEKATTLPESSKLSTEKDQPTESFGIHDMVSETLRPEPDIINKEKEIATKSPALLSTEHEEVYTDTPEIRDHFTIQHDDNSQSSTESSSEFEQSTNIGTTESAHIKVTPIVPESNTMVTENIPIETQTEIVSEAGSAQKSDKDVAVTTQQISEEILTTEYPEQHISEAYLTTKAQPLSQPTEQGQSDTTPYSVELIEHSHGLDESEKSPENVKPETEHIGYSTEQGPLLAPDETISTEAEEIIKHTTAESISVEDVTKTPPKTQEQAEKSSTMVDNYSPAISTLAPLDVPDKYTTEYVVSDTQKYEIEVTNAVQIDSLKTTEKPLPTASIEPSISEEELILVTTKLTTPGPAEEKYTQFPAETVTTGEDKSSIVPEDKLSETVTTSPEENLTESPKEIYAEPHEEKPTISPEEKPIIDKNASETLAENPEETTNINLNEVPVAVTEVPDENINEVSGQKPIDIFEEKPIEENVETPAKLPEDKLVTNPDETVTETPPKIPFELPDEKIAEIPKENPVETETPDEKVTETPVEIPAEEITETPEERPVETPHEKVTETPKEKPVEISDEKVTEISEEKPTEMPYDKVTKTPVEIPGERVSETPEEKPLEIPDEKFAKIPEEKPAGMPDEKVTEIPVEVPIEKVSETPDEKPVKIPVKDDGKISEEKPAEVPREQVTETPVETSDKQGSESPEERPIDIPDEKVTEIPEQKPIEVSGEKLSETPEERPVETPDEEITETPKEKPVEIFDEKVSETPGERPIEIPVENITETPKEKPDEVPHEQVSETPEEISVVVPVEKVTDNPVKIPDEKISETPEQRPFEIPVEKVSETPEEKPVEMPGEKVSESPETIPNEKVSETPEEKPIEIPDEKVSESPETIPDEKISETPEERPIEVPDEKVSESPETIPDKKVSETPEEKPIEMPDEKVSESPETIPDEKVSETPEEKPIEMPDEKVSESPETIPDEKVSETPEEKPSDTSEEKPIDSLEQKPSETPDEEIGNGGYGQEPDYEEADQAFGPGTCRYGGKVYVSAQQIPRDDPCDFCFCFRSDIICLQQSCPPPIHGCHEEPIQGFCCPRYECPVSMATTLNITTTTTTTTTTLPPHFPTHAYKGAAQRKGCLIKGHSYKVGEVVRASSGPCLHCTCGGDGQMKCDPKACTPEPMLRQMIAAAVSSKRRR